MLSKYADYTNVFFSKLAIELPKNIDMNKHAIKLVEGKQPSYRFIYSLHLEELETLKTYIKTDLKSRFICPSKFSADALSFFY